MISLVEVLGSCQIPVIIAWGLSYALLTHQMKSKLSPMLRTLALIAAYFVTALVVYLTGVANSLVALYPIALIIMAPLMFFLIKFKGQPVEVPATDSKN